MKDRTKDGQVWARVDAEGCEVAGTEMVHYVAALPYTPLEMDDNGVVARAALRECVDHGHEWSTNEQDRATVLLRDFCNRFRDEPRKLLVGGSIRMMQALLGPLCEIEGRGGYPAYPELRWSNFVAGVVCYRADVAAPLCTKDFEPYREYLEQLWEGPVEIATGASVGAVPGCVVVRRGAPSARSIGFVPAPLPERIPLVLPDD